MSSNCRMVVFSSLRGRPQRSGGARLIHAVKDASVSSGLSPGLTAAAEVASSDRFLSRSRYLPATREQEREFFRDFRYRIAAPDPSAVTDPRFAPAAAAGDPAARPLALVLGWAGASDKNLSKYCSVYHSAGCDTLAYYLPTRFIYDRTADVPYLAVGLLRGMEAEGLLGRPIFFHMLSDTGIMAYQGIRAVMRDDGVNLDTRGAVMDSCPGPIPEATLRRASVLVAISALCAVRDGRGPAHVAKELVRNAGRFWPNLARRARGLPADVSYCDGVWSGDFLRADAAAGHPELFLYSRADRYVSSGHIEAVLAERAAAGREADAVAFAGSAHVSHLMRYGEDYREAVWGFLHKNYFSKLGL